MLVFRRPIAVRLSEITISRPAGSEIHKQNRTDAPPALPRLAHIGKPAIPARFLWNTDACRAVGKVYAYGPARARLQMVTRACSDENDIVEAGKLVTDCHNCHLRRLQIFEDMTAEEVRKTNNFKSGELTVDRNTEILMEASDTPQIFTVLRGMGLRYKLTPDGRRQVLNFIFPGDLIGLQAPMLGELGHSVKSSTSMTLCAFNRKNFFDFFKSSVRRAYDITWLAASEEHFMGETLTTLGQRNAVESVAWAFVKVFQRGKALDLVTNNRMPMPFAQQDLADALGLSLVHTNKTIKRLRDRQLVNWSNGVLKIHDLEKLADIAGMDLGDVRERPLI